MRWGVWHITSLVVLNVRFIDCHLFIIIFISCETVVGASSLLILGLFLCSVLIETKEWKHNDLVKEKSTSDENDESNKLKIVEFLLSFSWVDQEEGPDQNGS